MTSQRDDQVLSLFLDGISKTAGLAEGVWRKTGTTVVGVEGRRGSRACSLYQLGAHSLLLTGDDFAVRFEELTSERRSITVTEFEATFRPGEVEYLGTGSDHVLLTSLGKAGEPRGVSQLAGATQLEQLEPKSASVIAAVSAFFDDCSADDLEEAEFDLQDLDPYLFAWTIDGKIWALAGARPFDERPPFYDIGVVVHPAGRNLGLGRFVVEKTAAAVLDDDRLPLYRCDTENHGSKRIAMSLGFSEAVRIDAYRWLS